MTAVAQGGAGCSACHLPPTFALAADSRSNGLDPGETRLFKAPSLRSVGLTGPYMHDGRFATLAEVVEFYDHGIQEGPALDPRLRQGSRAAAPEPERGGSRGARGLPDDAERHRPHDGRALQRPVPSVRTARIPSPHARCRTDDVRSPPIAAAVGRPRRKPKGDWGLLPQCSALKNGAAPALRPEGGSSPSPARKPSLRRGLECCQRITRLAGRRPLPTVADRQMAAI